MQRWSITSPKPFDVVVASVEEAIGRPNVIEFIANMTAATSYEEMQKVIHASPGARVVKAFNHMIVPNLEAEPVVNGARRVAFVSADDEDAKKRVEALPRLSAIRSSILATFAMEA